MSPRRAILAVLARLGVFTLLLSVPACSRGCSCIPGEKTYETLDGKVKVQLVRRVRWSGNHLVSAPSSHFVLRIYTDPPFTHPACEHTDMAENDAGTLIAYRCTGDKPWNILRLRGGDRHLYERAAPVGEGKEPDFDALPPLRDSVDRILDAAVGPKEGDVWSELVRSIGEEDGAPAAAKLAIRLCDRPAPEYGDDSWLDIVATFDDRATEQVRAGVCGKLSDPESSAISYARVAPLCPKKGPKILAAALTRFREALTSSSRFSTAARWAAGIAIRNDAKRAGEVACSSFPKNYPTEDDAVRFGLAAIGLGQVRCDGFWELRQWRPCGSQYDCENRLCSAAEVGKTLRRWIDEAFQDAPFDEWYPPRAPHEEHALLAAGYAQGELPAEVVLPNARRHYVLTNFEEPSCRKPLPRGTPCKCDSLDRDMMCRIGISETEITRVHCTFRLDDERRQIAEVRRNCELEGESCARGGAFCCPGLACGGPKAPQDPICYVPTKDGGSAAGSATASGATSSQGPPPP